MREFDRWILGLLRRFPLTLAVLGVGSSAGGAAVVALLAWLSGFPGRYGYGGSIIVVTTSVCVVVAMALGTIGSVVLQQRAFGGFTDGAPLNARRAERILRLPLRMSQLSALLWLLAVLVIGSIALGVLPLFDALSGVLLGLLGGGSTVGFTFVLADRVIRPATALALPVAQEPGTAAFSVRARLMLTWALAGGLPLVGVLLILGYPTARSREQVTAAIFVAACSLLIGLTVVALFARAVSSPLRAMRAALERIARGDRDIRVEVNDASEIGQLQRSVNDLAQGLNDQDRMRDLFGRHVGAQVAEHALSVGASLTGDVVEAAALFVDVIDSTRLAYRLPATELVQKLNRFLADVVAATGRHGGLVNKFEGDAALCVFGAPVQLDDPAAAAMAAARDIRDAVLAAGELDIGIGVSFGKVFAGQLGASERFEYTVIGDAVNEAARLTDAAKRVDARVLVSESAYAEAAEVERANWTKHKRIRLRGRGKATVTWTCARPAPVDDTDRPAG